MKKKKKKGSETDMAAESHEIRFLRKAKSRILKLLKRDGYTFEEGYLLCEDAYYEPHYVDFQLSNIERFPNGLSIMIAIYPGPMEAPYRSMDTFLQFIVWNIKHKYPCPAIVIIPDSGLRSHHLEYLKKNIDGNTLIHVFGLDEFEQWWDNWRPERLPAR